MTDDTKPQNKSLTIDGNEAVAEVAYRINEVIAIYPITPSSNMGEFSDEWAAKKRPNIWGTVPEVVELQSEGGASGAVHGSLQGGALTTTFTSSQGLLLMIPNMFKIAGELTALCMHVAARSVATHALSIFGDHSDINAARTTGFAMLSSNSVQEAHDMAAIGTAAALKSRVPTVHFFDGFRTSHEVSKISILSDDDLRFMIDEKLVREHRGRALNPEKPVLRGSAQNPDVFFQARETVNPFYAVCPDHVQAAMDRFASRVGRSYHLFDYVGHPEADRVVVMMGSGAETAQETVEWMNAKGGKVGLVKVHLYRPFSVKAFVAALPKSVRHIGVLDRTKEPGAVGEPLYMDVVTALSEAKTMGLNPPDARVIGGRYGLSSKEFTPAMVKAVYDELAKTPAKNHFTVGIVDDVSHASLDVDWNLDIEGSDVSRSVFFGLGADGTVGANKNSIKIIGEETPQYAQGYFVYDSKKSGAMTISHLRFGPKPIRSIYLIKQAGFVACHFFPFMDKLDVVGYAAPGAVFLLNAPYAADKVWDTLPYEVQQEIIAKKLRFYAIDAAAVAEAAGMGRRINTIMQTCFFAISGVLPREEAIMRIKGAIEKTYAKAGQKVIDANYKAVDSALAHMHEVKYPSKPTSQRRRPPVVSSKAPDFVKKVTSVMMVNKGDTLPVSAFTPDGTWPVSTTQWEKRNITLQVPVWEPSLCIQCNKCSLVCPHATIRSKVYDPKHLAGAPKTFKSADYKAPDFKGWKFTVQNAPEDCTGCTLCYKVCPGKDKANPDKKALEMKPQLPLVCEEHQNYAFFLDIPDPDRAKMRMDVKGTQFFRPLFEYSGACAGCGETPYLKLLTQMFGDRAVIANATGCSSIYGGNLPTVPYCSNAEGRGPAWSNSLFEDNAEFGLGIRLAVDSNARGAQDLLKKLSSKVGDTLVGELLNADQSTEAGIAAQRERVKTLKAKLAGMGAEPLAKSLEGVADYLLKKSVWIVGGDGWAYDIGYGGIDHVLAMGKKVNLLVLDTEVYSNTGGQQSKATPLGAAAKFAAAGKALMKKDLGLMAMAYCNVYVARVAFGAKDAQTVKAFQEAEAYPGSSIIIAYSHCIAQQYDLANGLEQQKKAVDSGVWPLYRFDPRLIAEGKPPLQLDSTPSGTTTAWEYMKNEQRFRIPEKLDAERFKKLVSDAEKTNLQRVQLYQALSQLKISAPEGQKPA
ncbi:MAG: pyruvate:ferredoxin (flavodoxin) oxidoreductase [Elusimicrobia bacterium]|nr:pyruvate:ferredoxin (flavodoxin) oxidoreductase [Elusimicrobiota bacterium]